MFQVNNNNQSSIGITIQNLKSTSSAKVSRIEKGCGLSFTIFGYAALHGRFLQPQATWLPVRMGDWKAQFIFTLFSVSSGVYGLYSYFNRTKIVRELEKQSKDPFASLKPEIIEKLWDNPTTHESLINLLPKLSFAQVQVIWKKLSNEEKETLEKNHSTNSFTVPQLMSTLEAAKSKTPDELSQFFLQETFTEYLRHNKDVFQAFRAVLSERITTKGFSALIFKMYYKIFNKELDISKVGVQGDVSLIIKNKKGDSVAKIESIDLGILETLRGITNFGSKSEKETTSNKKSLEVTLGDDSTITPEELKQVLLTYAQAEEPSLDWLLNNYEILSIYAITPLIYRMHTQILSCYSELNKHTTWTALEIANRLYAVKPENIKGKVANTWKSTPVDKDNLLIAMSFAEVFEIKELKDKCCDFISKNISDANQLYEAYLHADSMQQGYFKEACVKMLSSMKGKDFYKAWPNLFQMPDDLMKQLASRATIKSKINWCHLSTEDEQKIDKYVGNTSFFTREQLVNTLNEAKTIDKKDILSQLQCNGFIDLARSCPSFFEAFRDVVLIRNDADLKTALHHFYLKAYFPDVKIEENKETVQLKIAKGNELLSLSDFPVAVFNASGIQTIDNKIIIDPKCSNSAEDLKNLLEKFYNLELFSIEELHKYYPVIHEQKFAPLIFRFHQLVAQQEYEGSEISQEKIAHSIAEYPSVDESVCDLWSNVKKVDETNILVAMSLASIHSKYSALMKDKINLFARHLQEIKTLVKDKNPIFYAQLFKSMFELSKKLKVEKLTANCCNMISSFRLRNITITSAWENIFTLPEEIKIEVFKDISSLVPELEEENHNLTYTGFRKFKNGNVWNTRTNEIFNQKRELLGKFENGIVHKPADLIT